MKLKIFNETEKIVEKERELTLRLESVCGEVRLVAVNEDGSDRDCGFILSVRNNGDVKLYGSVNRNMGLKAVNPAATSARRIDSGTISLAIM